MGALLIIGIVVVSIMIYLMIGYATAKIMDDRNWIYKETYMDDDEEFPWVMTFWVFVLLFVIVREGGIVIYNQISPDKKE